MNQTEDMKKEARNRWGDTEAYKSYEKKKANGHDFDQAGAEMMEIFESIGKLVYLPPEDEKVQSEIKRLQDFISENFYPCTKEILMGLSRMYVSDERFQKNIDQKGGKGTAEFVSEAIKVYTNR